MEGEEFGIDGGLADISVLLLYVHPDSMPCTSPGWHRRSNGVTFGDTLCT